VPDLAIHLNRDINKGFEYNAQTQLPVLVAALPVSADSVSPKGASWALELVASELEIASDAILGADLYFVDAQRPVVLGPQSELVNGPRLDDLLGCHAILEAFADAPQAEQGQIACFLDNEEVGSRTAQGADSSFLRDTLGRICSLSGCSTQDFYRALSASFCVSVDVAQAFHPSYTDKYDDFYTPLLNGGPALKVNAAYRYATDAPTEARFRLLCESAGVSCQKLQSRADLSPGSTIGPMSSSLTGMPTVDVGAPLLSMHAIRETAGVRDHKAMTAAIGALYTRSLAR
jgi:aspartyl aminopeptidase